MRADDDRFVLTDDVVYVARATGIAAKDLHLIARVFSEYITKHGTRNSEEAANAFFKWLADSSISLWEYMVPVGIGMDSVSEHYETGYAMAQSIESVDAYMANTLRARWDAILTLTQEMRIEWGDGVVVEEVSIEPL
jgi:hypothetical protein